MSSKTILVVDDSLVLLKALSIKLGAHGYKVVTVSDTASALGAVSKEKPDLIILDVNFPADSGWDGFGLMQWLQRMDQTKQTPVVIISGSDEGSYQERCRKAGAVGFFLKPLDYEQLLATLRDALHQAPEDQAFAPSPIEAESSASPERSNQPELILMVEDDVSLGQTLELFLQSQNFRVTRVTSGEEGLREVSVTDFDIVLCDMVMPTMPGNEFYQAVERVKPSLCKRFIFMTGHQADPRSDGFIRRIRALMLWKPFLMADLLTAIEVVWKKSQSSPRHNGSTVTAAPIALRLAPSFK